MKAKRVVPAPSRATASARRPIASAVRPAASRTAQAPASLPTARKGFFDGLAVEPLASGSRDSDGNRTVGAGLGVDIPMGPRSRLGVQSVRTRVANAVTRGSVDDARVRATWRPRRTLRIEASAGGARLAPPTAASEIRWVGGLRTRWRAKGGSPALELRLDRVPLLANSILLDHHAMRSDGRFGLELPVRALRLRGAVRGAMIESDGDRNQRGQVDAALALSLVPAVTPFLQYRAMGYRHPASSGYFAPHRVEIVESGSSFELGRGSPWLLSLELGAGLQHIQPFGEPMHAWGPALRGYGYLSYATAAGCELRLEAESEDSPGAATTASEHWRYSSLSLGVRWPLP